MVDVIDPDGQRPHRDRGVVALEFDPGRFCRAGREDAVDHDVVRRGFFQASSGGEKGQELVREWWRESKGRRLGLTCAGRMPTVPGLCLGLVGLGAQQCCAPTG